MEELTTSKVMLAIVCDLYEVDEVIDHVRASGVARFTMFRGVLGTGETGRREGTAVWPGQNAALLCCVSEAQVAPVLAELRRLHDSRPQHTMPLKIFALPAQELL